MSPALISSWSAHTDAGSQYTGFDYTQELDDHRVLRSIGTVGDAYDNAMAESFVDTFKTELIADRVWRTRSQLELATVEWIGWFNHRRLHEASADIPPIEYEAAPRRREPARFRRTERSRPSLPSGSDGLTQRRLESVGAEIVLERPLDSENGPGERTLLAQAAPQVIAMMEAQRVASLHR